MKRVCAARPRRPRNVALVVVTHRGRRRRRVCGVRGSAVPDLPTAEVTKGEFVDTLEIRGDIRPLQVDRAGVADAVGRAADRQAREERLDGEGRRRRRRSSTARCCSGRCRRSSRSCSRPTPRSSRRAPQGKITEEQNATALMKCALRHRAREARREQGGHGLADRQRAGEADARRRRAASCTSSRRRSSPTGPSAEADVAARQRKREKAIVDLQRAERGLQNLAAAGAGGRDGQRPAELPRGEHVGRRAGVPRGRSRLAGRVDPGAARLSSVHLEARLDESDRGRLKVGQDAIVRIEAVPGREFKARINDISVLAKVDFTSGWPPPKNFDLGLVLLDVDPEDPSRHDRRRPHRDRARSRRRARAVRAIFQRDGAPIVYRLDGSEFVATPRRGRSAAAGSRRSSPRASTRRPRRDPPAGAGDDQEGAMKRRGLSSRAVLIAIVGAGAALTIAVPAPARRAGRRCPTTRVTKGPLKLTVHATGELRAGRTMTLVAPPVGGGCCAS